MMLSQGTDEEPKWKQVSSLRGEKSGPHLEQDESSFERWGREPPGGSGGMHGPVVLYCELILDWLAIYSG